MTRLYLGGAALAFIGFLIWATYSAGRDAAREAIEAQKAKDFQTTTERINDADIGTGDPDDDLDWLHDYAKRNRPR